MPTYQIALDLGSDSMAAYYSVDGGEAITVPLQKLADELCETMKPDILTEENNLKSDRLASRIELRNNQAGDTISDQHALLDFFDFTLPVPKATSAYKNECAFGYMPDIQAPPRFNSTMPNPKVMYQYGISDAFSNWISATRQPMNVMPEQVISHVTVQLVRNLILTHDVLRRAKPHEVHLILTVPNVYSVEHAEHLREEVQRLTNFDKVTTVSESDALAFYYKGNHALKQRFANDKSVQTSRSGAPDRIVTLDIGRGTTDLSVIEECTVNGQIEVTTRARTGRSSGGGELTYIFAKFYEYEIERVFREHGHLLGTIPVNGIDRPIEEPPISFLWLKTPQYRDNTQFKHMFGAMRNLIERVKREFSATYLMHTDELSYERIKTIVDSILIFQEEALKTTTHNFDPNWRTTTDVLKFHEILCNALRVNAHIGEGLLARVFKIPTLPFDDFMGRVRGFLAQVLGSQTYTPKAKTPKRSNTAADNRSALAAEIKKYVTDNIDNLIIELGTMIAPENGRRLFERRPLRDQVEVALYHIIEQGKTSIIVGGQASQFKPMKDRIEAIFERGNYKNKLAAFGALQGSEAKIGCCKGALMNVRAGQIPAKEGDLLGSYGVMPSFSPLRCAITPANMNELNRPHLGKTTVNMAASQAHDIMYSPGIFPADNTWDEAKVCSIQSIIERDYIFTYQAAPGNKIRRLCVNGDRVKVGGFNNLQSPIWPKLWPDQIPTQPITI